eukprot:scaffold28844_cov153-Isochrysis_galbana.AAC.5
MAWRKTAEFCSATIRNASAWTSIYAQRQRRQRQNAARCGDPRRCVCYVSKCCQHYSPAPPPPTTSPWWPPSTHPRSASPPSFPPPYYSLLERREAQRLRQETRLLQHKQELTHPFPPTLL